MENDRKYVKFDYSLDEPYCSFDELGLIPIENDEFLNEIEFKDQIVTLYFKEDFILQENQNEKDLENYAKDKLFAIMLEIVNNSNAKKFSFDIDESRITNIRHFYASTNNVITVSNSVNVKMRKADGTFVTEEENRKNILESNKKKMQDIVANSNSNFNIQDKDKEKFIKLFQIKDPVIKYFVIYSWLVELNPNAQGYGSQAKTEQFITNSPTFEWINKITKVRKKDDGIEVEEDIFTHLRNLIGHSINDILTLDDKYIVEQIEQYTNPLIKIILEKLNESEE